MAKRATTRARRPQVFISHASTDHELSAALFSFLNTAVPDATLFFTEHEGFAPRPGADLASEHKKAIASAQVFVAVVTDSFWESAYCVSELGAAWALGIHIIPISIGSQAERYQKSFLGNLVWVKPDTVGLLNCEREIAVRVGVSLSDEVSVQKGLDTVVHRIPQITQLGVRSVLQCVSDIHKELASVRGVVEPLTSFAQDLQWSGSGSAETVVVAVRRLERLLLEHAARSAHVTAVGQLVRHYTEQFIPGLIEQLAISIKNSESFKLEDRSTIYELLVYLADAMPGHGAWLGISHLMNVEGWAEKKAHPQFLRYAYKMRERAQTDLKVLRLYCADSAEQVSAMRPFLDRECKAHLEVRTVVGVQQQQRPRDMSLLFAPTAHRGMDQASDVSVIRQMECDGLSVIAALEFGTRNEEALEWMNVHNRGSAGCAQLKDEFADWWARGSIYSPEE